MLKIFRLLYGLLSVMIECLFPRLLSILPSRVTTCDHAQTYLEDQSRGFKLMSQSSFLELTPVFKYCCVCGWLQQRKSRSWNYRIWHMDIFIFGSIIYTKKRKSNEKIHSKPKRRFKPLKYKDIRIKRTEQWEKSNHTEAMHIGLLLSLTTVIYRK